jgi:glycine hydroxymethyltransferase
MLRQTKAPTKRAAAKAQSKSLKKTKKTLTTNKRKNSNKALLNASLKESDPEVYNIIQNEAIRQRDSLCLIPSENFTSQAVLDALGSIMQNKYSEGYPNARYYGGNEFIDQSESLCQARALKAFNLDPTKWGVNVQPLSGSPANFQVYTALLPVHGRIMSLDLPHGGHLSHGYSIPSKHISAVSKYFEILPYRLNEQTGTIDYDTLKSNAKLYRPKLIVMGASAYSRHIEYDRIRQVADENNSVLMCDMAHISGLVAAGVMPSPFEFADIVTTTTHKTLRGPRGAMIFYRKGVKGQDKNGVDINYNFESEINSAVFPGHQGGPHNHTITALAVALKQAATPEFKTYQQNVLDNNKAMANYFQKKNYKLVGGGTDNHLLLIDVRDKGLNGAKVEKIAEMVNIALNKNTIPGDVSALNPGGIRIGSPAMTTRNLGIQDFEKVAEFVDRVVEITKTVQKDTTATTLKAFKDQLAAKEYPEISALKNEIVQFSRQFPAVPEKAVQM